MLSLIEILFYIIICLLIIFVIINIKNSFINTNKKEHLDFVRGFNYSTKGQKECENQLNYDGIQEIHYIGNNSDANKYFNTVNNSGDATNGFIWMYCNQTGTKESCQKPYNFYKPSEKYYPTDRDIHVKSCNECIKSDYNNYYDRRVTNPDEACKNINGKTSVELHNNCISRNHGEGGHCITNSCSYIQGGKGGIIKPGKCVKDPNSNWWYVKTDNSDNNVWQQGKTCATKENNTEWIYELQEPITKGGKITDLFPPGKYNSEYDAKHGSYWWETGVWVPSMKTVCNKAGLYPTGGWWQGNTTSVVQCISPSTTTTPAPKKKPLQTVTFKEQKSWGEAPCIQGWSKAECNQNAAAAGLSNSSTLDYKETNMELCGKGPHNIFRNIDNKGNWNGRCWQEDTIDGLANAQAICSNYGCSAISYECDIKGKLCAYEPRFGLPTSVTEWNNHDNICPKAYPYAYSGEGQYNKYCCDSTEIFSSGRYGSNVLDVCKGNKYVACDNPPCKNYVNFQRGYNFANKSWGTEKLKSGTGYCAYRQ